MLKVSIVVLILLFNSAVHAEPVACWNFAVSTYEIAKALGPKKYVIFTEKSNYADQRAILITNKTSFKDTGSINIMRRGRDHILGVWVRKLKEKGTYTRDGFERVVTQYEETDECFNKCEKFQLKPLEEINKNVKLVKECNLDWF